MPKAKAHSKLPTSKQKSNQISDGLDFVEDGGSDKKAADVSMMQDGDHDSSGVVAPLPSSPPPLPPPIPVSEPDTPSKLPLPGNSEPDQGPPSKKRKVANLKTSDSNLKLANSDVNNHSETSMIESDQNETQVESEQGTSAFESEVQTDATLDTEQVESGSGFGREFDVIDDLADAEQSDSSGECSSSEEEFIDDKEIEEWLEAGVEEGIKRRQRQEKQRREAAARDEEAGGSQDAIVECQKVILKELEHNPFEILPEGWIAVTHNSGMPVYLHRESRVCTMAKPYFLGPGSARKHEIPISAIPCLQYRTVLKKKEENEKNATKSSTEGNPADGDVKKEESDQTEKGETDVTQATEKLKTCPNATKDGKLEDGELATDGDAADVVPMTTEKAVTDNTSTGGDKLEDGELPTENADASTAKDGAADAGGAAEAIAAATKETVKVQSAKERKQETNLEPEEVRKYCQGLFHFKTLTVRRYKTWKDRRNFVNKDRKNRKRPELPDDTQLITCQIRQDPEEEKMPCKKKAFVINPAGKSNVSILHEYAQIVLRTQPQYVYQEIDNAKTPYGAKVVINGVEYGIGCAGSKKQAKAEAARITLGILIPKMTKILDPKAREEHDLSYFDEIKVEDPRVAELCVKAGQPTPAHIMVECLKRYHGMGNTECQMEMKKIKHQKNEFTMKVGKHEVKVICQNKREGKQLAAQAILQKMHPHITCWGSLLRLYGKGCLGAMQKVISELLDDEEDSCKVSMELDTDEGQGQNNGLVIKVEGQGQMECGQSETGDQGVAAETVDKEVLVKPQCGHQETSTERVEHRVAEIQVSPSTESLAIQVDRADFTEDESTQWDIRIMGVGLSAFPSVERATKIRPLKYADGLYYHRATQTDWRGQSLFHKATQFPDHAYKDADKEAAATGNIQIISTEQAAAAKMLMSGGGMPYASMYNMQIAQPPMMYMAPQMMPPMMPLMSPPMELGDVYQGQDAASAADTASVQEMETRSCSSEGTPDAQGMFAGLGSSPQLTPKGGLTPPSGSPHDGLRNASPARQGPQLYPSPHASPRPAVPRSQSVPRDTTNAPLYPLPLLEGDVHIEGQQGQTGKQIPARYSQQRREASSNNQRGREPLYERGTSSQQQMAAPPAPQRRDAVGPHQVSGGYQQQLPGSQMAPGVQQPQMPGQNPYRYMYPGGWYMTTWR